MIGRKFYSVNQKVLAMLTMAFVSLAANAQSISGRVTDQNGKPIFKANIMEMDKNHRILNQTTSDKNGNFVMSARDTLAGHLCITCNGYVMMHERIRNTHDRFHIHLEERKPSRLSTLSKNDFNTKNSSFETRRLLCGRSGAHVEPWNVVFERISKDTYILQLPVKASHTTGVYKEGRTITFLDDNDYQIILCYNGEDAPALRCSPNDYEFRKNMQEIGNYKAQTGTQINALEEDIYYFPQFVITQDDLDILMAQPERLARIAVDTEDADNYWLVYPLDTFTKEMKKILTKMNNK